MQFPRAMGRGSKAQEHVSTLIREPGHPRCTSNPLQGLEPISVVPPGFGRLHARAASSLGLVVFSEYVVVLAPCIAGVRSASGQRMDY